MTRVVVPVVSWSLHTAEGPTVGEQTAATVEDAPETVASLRAERDSAVREAELWRRRFDYVRRALIAAGDDSF